MLTGGILVTEVLKVGVNAALWGTFLRHYTGVSNHQGPGALLQVTRSYLHRIDPPPTLSLGDGPPLAPDARLFATSSIRGCDKGEE